MAGAIPFETFASFRRLNDGQPILFREPPEWAAAAHALVLDETVHYLWGSRRIDNWWELHHSTAPVLAPEQVTHDPRNPVVVPSGCGFDAYTIEYPCLFVNPFDRRLYCYYLGRRQKPPKQTGLLVSDGDWGVWQKLVNEPVIAAETAFETRGSSHPSAAIDGDTIHLLYTGESSGPDVLCHATASLSDPLGVIKDPGNPVFEGSGAEWDSQGVREAELLKGPEYFHIFYGGSDGTTWRAGHVRTKDFRTFEANPANPLLDCSKDPEAFDSNGILTPQVFRCGDRWAMLYAGQHGTDHQTGLTWQSGLAVAT